MKKTMLNKKINSVLSLSGFYVLYGCRDSFMEHFLTLPLHGWHGVIN